MIIDKNQLDKIHTVQIEILKNVIEVCDKLNIKYYMVHGSLLGAVRVNGYLPLDDDIDIAMFRSDYEKFLTEGQSLINSRYFIQSELSDKDYPIEFAKVRDSNTTFITYPLRNLKINHGIYIDIFPIDTYTPMGFFKSLKYKLLNTRIRKRFYSEKITFMDRVKFFISSIIYPSWHKAIKKRNGLFLGPPAKNNPLVQLTGGKLKERGIPAEWFSEPSTMLFEGIKVSVPAQYDKYLAQIYGDYNNRTLLEDKYHDPSHVEVIACVVDAEKPFIDYLR